METDEAANPPHSPSLMTDHFSFFIYPFVHRFSQKCRQSFLQEAYEKNRHSRVCRFGEHEDINWTVTPGGSWSSYLYLAKSQ